MLKQKVISLTLISFLLIVPYSTLSADQNHHHTWYVNQTNKDGPWLGTLKNPFLSIQSAINAAHCKDTITVFPGIYNENLTINKPLILQSKEPNQSIIDGKYAHTVLKILHPNVKINGFIIRNSSGSQKSSGVQCDASHILISHCHFYRTRSGVIINQTKNITISNCLFHTNGGGINLYKANNIKILQNNYLHNGLGINSNSSQHIAINDSYATVNGIGMFFNRSNNITITQSAIFNNNDNQGGIFLTQSENIFINDSIIKHNGFGIKPRSCKNINIYQSTIQHCTHVGIYTSHSTDINLTKCLLKDNFRFSLHSVDSLFSINHSNLFSSLVGIYAENSKGKVTENWWGSSFGPVFFENPTIDRIRLKSSRLKIWPVLSQSIPTGASWTLNLSRCQIPSDRWLHPFIELSGKDSDTDYVPDYWEKQYGYDPFIWNDHHQIDSDCDGLSNVEECFTSQWGSDPYVKDIFLEIDWMESKYGESTQNRLTNEDIQTMKEVFAVKNINLHIDHGTLGGGEQVPYQSHFSYADLRDIYWDYFLHEDLNNPRKGIFHYCIINDYGPGPGFAFVGWDGLDSFDISAQQLQDNQPSIDRNLLIVGGGIHELGHTLGLTVDDHQGNDNQVATWLFTKQWWQYRQYKSCMNYWYTYRILGFSDGTHGPYDFNDWSHMDFSFFKNTHFDLPPNK